MVKPWEKEEGDIGQLKNMSLGCRKTTKKGRVRVAFSSKKCGGKRAKRPSTFLARLVKNGWFVMARKWPEILHLSLLQGMAGFQKNASFKQHTFSSVWRIIRRTWLVIALIPTFFRVQTQRIEQATPMLCTVQIMGTSLPFNHLHKSFPSLFRFLLMEI